MSDGEDFLFRPVRANMCRMESLKDGTLDLMDIVRANECLDVEAENESRISEYYRDHGR